MMSVRLLVICTEVFDGSGYIGFFHTKNLYGTDPSGQVRILGDILKVTAVQRVSVNIHTRSEQGIDTVLSHLASCHLVQIFYQRKVKRTAKQGSVRHGEGSRSAVKAESGRAVGTAGCRNTEFLQFRCQAAECCCGSRSNLRAAHALAAEDADQIFIGKLCHELFHRYFLIQDITELVAFVTGIGDRLHAVFFHALDRIYGAQRSCLISRF